MNILFLDDSKDRWEAIKSHLPKAKWVKSVKYCIAMLPDTEWNIVLLDHDLGEAEDGMAVVEWIIKNQPIIRNIVCHSENFAGAERMAAALREAEYKVDVVPFSTLLGNLRKTHR